MKFLVGDTVEVLLRACEDVHHEAWKYITHHPYGTVKGYLGDPARQTLAVEFPEEFAGGIDCQGMCATKRGQFVMEGNVALCFEASRPVNTVPTIKDRL
jgi:hypothetical protein